MLRSELEGWGRRPLVERLPHMSEALDSIPSIGGVGWRELENWIPK